jgi:hypothetical protein
MKTRHIWDIIRKYGLYLPRFGGERGFVHIFLGFEAGKKM